MLFTSYTFIIFFIITLVISRSLGNWRCRKTFLLTVSYLFYAAWNPPFVLLLWISTFADWYLARWVYATRRPSFRRIGLALSLLINIGMLSFFKYGNFLIDTFNELIAWTGIQWSADGMNIVLPVGISFYTFQTLSYTIDAYHRRFRPWHSFLDYALYVTFFPQLVAGPIVRAADFLPQCAMPRKGTAHQVGWGICLFIIGLFAKVVLADTFSAPMANAVYANATAAGFLNAWAGTLAFAMQIFYDFFGYTTCAIGIALTLGFALPDNFRFPYAACGFSDFWRRWHISLSTWLRDYLYIPLGGNRKGKLRLHANLMITMLLGGLWHGASWMFVIWGGLHGFYLIAERWICKTTLAQWPLWRHFSGKLLLTLLTFTLVCITWVFFRAESLTGALSLTRAMLSPAVIIETVHTFFASGFKIGSIESVWIERIDYPIIALLTSATLTSHYVLRHSSIEAFFARLPGFARVLLITLMAYAVLICMTGEDNAFIYFQF